ARPRSPGGPWVTAWPGTSRPGWTTRRRPPSPTGSPARRASPGWTRRSRGSRSCAAAGTCSCSTAGTCPPPSRRPAPICSAASAPTGRCASGRAPPRCSARTRADARPPAPGAHPRRRPEQRRGAGVGAGGPAGRVGHDGAPRHRRAGPARARHPGARRRDGGGQQRRGAGVRGEVGAEHGGEAGDRAGGRRAGRAGGVGGALGGYDHACRRVGAAGYPAAHGRHQLAAGGGGAARRAAAGPHGRAHRRRAHAVGCAGRAGRGGGAARAARRLAADGGARDGRRSRVHEPEPRGGRDEPGADRQRPPGGRGGRQFEMGSSGVEHDRVARRGRRRRQRRWPRTRGAPGPRAGVRTAGAGVMSGTPRVRRTTARMADGRELIYFDDVTRDRVPPPDTRDLPAVQTGSIMRYDVLTGEWVAIAAHRQDRTFLPPADACPLCPTRPGRAPSEIPADDYDVVVFENRFPSFAQDVATDVPAEVDGDPLFPQRPAIARCEVVCFTSDHDSSFGALPVERVRTVIEAWADRRAALSALPGVEQVFPFENRGTEIGVTLEHPHGQIYAYPFVTPRTGQLLTQAAEHRQRTGRDLFDDVLAAERKAGTRIVREGTHFTVFVPAAAR